MRRIVTTVLAAAAAAITAAAPAGASAAGEWPQQGGNPAHTSQIRSPGNLTTGTVRSLTRQFSTSITAQPGPAVAGSVAYVTTPAGYLVALSTASGHRLWSQRTCDHRSQGSQLWADTAPAVGGAVVWVNSGYHLTGVSLRTHAVVACLGVGTPSGLGTGSPTVLGGSVYLANGGHVYAASATTGALRWSRPLPAGVAVGTVAVDRGLVLVPAAARSYRTGTIYALRSRDGAPVWTYHSRQVTSVTAAGGRVFLDDPLTALDEATGRTLWTRPGYLPGAGLSVDGSQLYVYCGESSTAPVTGTCDGDVLAFDAATGRLRWNSSISSEGTGVVSVGGGVVYVTDPIDTGQLVLLNKATGTVLARRSHPGGYFTSQPVVADGHVYLLGNLTDSATGFFDRWGT